MSTPEAATRLRLFCAVELPAAVRARAVEHIKRLRASAPHVKASWERAEKLHITLKFFGAIEADRLAALTEAATRAADAATPFELILEGAGAFPPTPNPRVLWLGTNDPTGHLASLHERLETECAAAGFAREPRPFHAHITLARLRAANAATRRLARYHTQLGCPPLAFQVGDLLIMRSDLGPSGSTYTQLARLAFKQ